MEKLSSGMRINRAGDDAAGLAISEKMRAQVRGLDQASANSQDAISMIQTAEGALGETHSILQRMRELATQASNDTNVGVDRNEIQKEMNQLSSEINRIGNTTEFNTQGLLQGNGKANLDTTNIANAAGKLGVVGAGIVGSDAKTTEASRTDTVAGPAATSETLAYTINGQTLTMTFTTDANLTGANASELNDASVGTNAATIGIKGANTVGGDRDAIVEAMNAMIEKNDTLKGNFKVTASGADSYKIEALSTGAFKGAAGSISVATDATTNITDDTAAVAGVNTAAVAATREIDFSALNGAGTTTGDTTTDTNIKALVGTGMTIAGQQIEFYNSNDGAYTGSAIGVNISTALANPETTDGDKVKELVKNIAQQVGSKIEGVTLVQNTTTATKLNITASVAGAAGNNIEVSDGGVQKDFAATFQVGANKGQSMTINIADMRSEALGITGKAGEAGYTATNSVTDGTNNTVKESALDVSSHTSASAAIETINKAIETVSAERSKLGAYQNRLDHTINNLGTSSENLTAAESRIRDVDMAKEMMNQTKESILAQASQAMLAQANQKPQSVLQLLQ